MLSKEENELLTRVGPGTPCGELLRRYWQPVAFASELTDEKPIRRIKVMHEDLVLFRDKQGNYGCLAERCAHRGTSLYYGFVEDGGIRCCYHGWKFDCSGNCLEQPFEPAGSRYAERVKQRSYPVQMLGGVLFIYMGPDPAPLLPRWDVLARTDGQRKLIRWQVLDCNWLQAEENSADVTHTYYLHGHTMHEQGVRGVQVDYYYRPFVQYGFQPFEWGLLKSWAYSGAGTALGDEEGGGNPLIFPNSLRVLEQPWHAMHFRVPIDDTKTQVFWVGFLPSLDPNHPLLRSHCAPDCAACDEWAAGVRHDPERPPTHVLPDFKTEDGEYNMQGFFAQDRAAWETAGEIYDRSEEHLGASDRGIVLFRRMLREQIEVVQRGEDPLGIIRDPEKNILITVPTWVAEMGPDELEMLRRNGGGEPDVTEMNKVFTDKHEVFVVQPNGASPNGRKHEPATDAPTR